MIQASREHFKSSNVLAYRMVENQQKSASLELVSYDREKHDILEELLEDSKPPPPSQLHKRHYLIKTPFRYPPLKYGSRFGRTHEPGIFYACLSKAPLYAEVAFYRFVFLADMEESFDDAITTEHTVFNIRIKSERCLFLDEAPYLEHQQHWSNKTTYIRSQELGTQAREISTDVLRYISARCPKEGRNLAVFDPTAIKRNPMNLRAVRCSVTEDKCVFFDPQTLEIESFGKEVFMANGELPRPSA